MKSIRLKTFIEAPIERVFDLARSIDAHMAGMESSGEIAVSGKTSGLIGLNETVTWEAKHLGFKQRLSVKITAFDRPHFFADEMTRGAFASMKHRHDFEAQDEGTLMKDCFEFSAPLGIVGRIAEFCFLETYMKNLLVHRNSELKQLAESDNWTSFLPYDG
jgi:ligand-binding SRPBCC domain-containing protein